MLIRCKNGCKNPPQCYILLTLPVLLKYTFNATEQTSPWALTFLQVVKHFSALLC